MVKIKSFSIFSFLMQHSVWNLYSKIHNGLLARKKSILHPKNVLCIQVLKSLYREGYLSGFRVLPSNSERLEVFLKYNSSKPVISNLVAPSKPGRRIYISAKTLWKVNTSVSTLIISTSRGVFSDKECRRLNLGGEILCIVS